jgi:hypothetical protein
MTRLALVVLCLALALPGLFTAQAQEGRAQLVGRAVLPAGYLTDGPPAGVALSNSPAMINGVRVPFDSQPVGTISAILPGQYPGTWLALSDGQLGESSTSGDYMLRFFVLEVDLRRAGSGSGEVNLLDRQILADAEGRLERPIVNAETSTRYLTGADFTPRAFQRGGGGTFWVADEQGPSLLRFDGVGRLLEPPIPLDGAGALQGMGILPDGSALIVAQRAGGSRVVFRTFDLTTRTFADLPGVYDLENAGTNIGGLAMINTDEALVIETDSGEGRSARFKRLFLVNVRAEDMQKTQLADLLDLDDPNGISTDPVFVVAGDEVGLGSPFSFPFQEVTALYPLDEQTIIIANNNRLPYGRGRSASQADATEFIAVALPQPVRLDAAFMRPMQ